MTGEPLEKKDQLNIDPTQMRSVSLGILNSATKQVGEVILEQAAVIEQLVRELQETRALLGAKDAVDHPEDQQA